MMCKVVGIFRIIRVLTRERQKGSADPKVVRRVPEGVLVRP
jgi:hypothetical protein